MPAIDDDLYRDSPDAPGRQAPALEAEKCRAVKHGRVDLRCILPWKHEGWHEASYTDHQEVDYDGAHHTVHVTEHVTWEPVEAAAEAVRHLFRERAPGA
jgi:hypothetical protein